MKIRSEEDIRILRDQGVIRGIDVVRATRKDPASLPPEDKLATAVDAMRSYVEKMTTTQGQSSDTMPKIMAAQEDTMSVMKEILTRLVEIQAEEEKPEPKKKWKFTPVRDSRGFIETITVEEV